jgi:transglutaminase-like putative cysteine protease
MLIEIKHTTTYSYEKTARYAVEALRLTPPDFEGQRVRKWSIEAPGIETAVRFMDGFGNVVHLTTQSGAHDGITIIASGLIETFDCVGVSRGLPEIAPTNVYLRETPQTRPDSEIRALAQKCNEKGRLDTLHSLMGEVSARVAYEIGVTHEHTSAADALADGRGVCQDHAHVFISAARQLGIPARYVNGYFLSGTLAPSEAHHAWAEAWVEGLGWIGFDPANLICPTERYVRLATGLDAASAAPIRGIQRGGDKEALDVAVEVHQQGSQQ